LIDALLEHHAGMVLTAGFAARWLRRHAVLILAYLRGLAGVRRTCVLISGLVNATHELLPGMRVATLITGRRWALAGAFEKLLDRFAKTPFTIVAMAHAIIENSKRLGHTVVATGPAWHALSICGRIEH